MFGNNPKDRATYYKGMDENFKCHGFQFEVGKTYKHDGEIKICLSGFHSCTNPWDVLRYYDITSRFSLVEVGGKIEPHPDDTKIASAEITIKAELKLPEFIDACISFINESCMADVPPSSGDYSSLAASGNYSNLAASGCISKLAASGEGSKMASSGDYNSLSASGCGSSLAASGYDSKMAASGDYSSLAASGNYSNLAASGHGSKLAASGYGSISICSGTSGKVKGGSNCALALTRWVESEKRYRITTAYVGEDGIKADTWYSLDNDGKFIEQGE